MTKKGEGPLDGREIPEHEEGEEFDFTQSPKKSRTMLNPEIMIPWNTYMGAPTALGVKLLTQVAVDAGKGPAQPDLLHLKQSTPGSQDVVARPVVEKGPSTININWVGKKRKVPRLELQAFLKIHQFTIPHGMKAYIPMERPKTGDPRIILRFSEARFAEIDKTGRRKSSESSGSSGSNSGTTGDKTAS